MRRHRSDADWTYDDQEITGTDLITVKGCHDHDDDSGGRPETGRESKYLLSGLARCSKCGGNMVVLSGRSGSRNKRHKINYYVCSYNHNRGFTICDNDHRELIERIDDPFLAAIEKSVLTPEAIEEVIERTIRKLEERHEQEPQLLESLRRQIQKTECELANLLNLAAQGSAPASILSEIRKREEHIEALQAEREQLAAATQLSALDTDRLREDIRDSLSHFTALMHDNVPRARQAIRKFLRGPVRLTPIVVDSRKTYRFDGETPAGPLLPPAFVRLASPRGFEGYKSHGNGLPALPFEELASSAQAS